MEYLVGNLEGTDLDALAKSYMFETLKREELSWRIWLTTHMPIERIEILRAANKRGGVILSFMHHAQYASAVASVSRHGFGIHATINSWFLTQKSRTYAGMRGRQHVRSATAGGAQLFDASGSFGRIAGLLEAGEVVAIASDALSTTKTQFLERDVTCASGAARLAIQTGAAIVPMTAHRHGFFQRIRLGDPIDPTPYEDNQVLLREILRRHESAVREWPEALERPMTRFLPVTDADIARFSIDPSHQKLFPL